MAAGGRRRTRLRSSSVRVPLDPPRGDEDDGRTTGAAIRHHLDTSFESPNVAHCDATRPLTRQISASRKLYIVGPAFEIDE